MLPADTPKLPKWPFFLTDVGLLLLAWYVASQHHASLNGAPLYIILACVVCGTLLAAVPLISDYARKQDEALDERQRALESLSRTVASSAEQISIAVQGLQTLTELARKDLKAAEQAAPKLQEKIAALKADVGSLRDEENQKLRKELAAARGAEAVKLEAAAKKILKALADLSKAAPLAAPVVSPLSEPPPIPGETIPEIAPVAPSDSRSPIVPRKRAPRKPRAVEPAPEAAVSPESEAAPSQVSEPEAAAKVEPPVTPKAGPRVVSDVEPTLDLPIETPIQQAEVVERVRSSDGATRLLVTAYIGIGNRLFIRGEGPGLSMNKGVPLQFVSIGKWRWETAEAGKPVTFKLYKNDDTECTALGAQTIDPGQQEEVIATF